MPIHQSPAEEHDDHGGLHRDVPALVGRRDMLRVIGGLGVAGLLAACGVETSSSSPNTTNSVPTTGSAGVVDPGIEIPDETAGPYPADGSNGPNVLDDGGIVRADLTTSFGGSSGVAEGTPIRFSLSVVDAASGDPVVGAAVYLWHCTADGRYSIYEIADQNYLRGIQVADEAGRITYNSIFPGCYAGRWPHAHFEVYPSLEQATSGSGSTKISQLALPRADCETVYADSRYGNSAESLTRLSLDTDNVFRDGWADQLATVEGSPSAGYTASLLVRV